MELAGERRRLAAAARAELARFGVPADDVDPVEGLYRLWLEALGDRSFYRLRLEAEHEQLGAAGLLGVDRSGALRPSVWHELAAEAEARATRLARALIDARFEERRLRVAEAEAEALVAAVLGSLAALGVDADDDGVRAVVAEQLSQLALPA